MDGARTVLVVSADGPLSAWWSDELERAGFDVSTCSGPYVTKRCPRLDGEPCELRESAQVAVVEVQPSVELYGGSPERVCTRIPDDGRTVFVDTDNAVGGVSYRHPSAAEALTASVEAVMWKGVRIDGIGFAGS